MISKKINIIQQAKSIVSLYGDVVDMSEMENLLSASEIDESHIEKEIKKVYELMDKDRT